MGIGDGCWLGDGLGWVVHEFEKDGGREDERTRSLGRGEEVGLDGGVNLLRDESHSVGTRTRQIFRVLVCTVGQSVVDSRPNVAYVLCMYCLRMSSDLAGG